MRNMCLSVNKALENCRESIKDLLEARPIEAKESAQVNGDDVREAEEENVFISDNLALTTQYTRQFFKLCIAKGRKMQTSTFYKIMTRTTQPAHLASIVLVLFISYNLWPETYQDQASSLYVGKSRSPLTSFLYLGSFAAHFGAQLWMTFVSGLALYFSLPRHTFGMCQEILFPKYFLINTLLSTMTLITFAKMHTNFNDSRWIAQLMALSTCLLIEMGIFLYLTPSLLKLMRAKYQFEQKLGNGDEIGYQRTLPSAIECPEYKEVHKKFRKVHFKCAMGNIITICCTFMHLYYLASKITVL